jgi:hypothetical protein
MSASLIVAADIDGVTDPALPYEAELETSVGTLTRTLVETRDESELGTTFRGLDPRDAPVWLSLTNADGDALTTKPATPHEVTIVSGQTTRSKLAIEGP